ncbi:MAG: hypothetical protein KDE46_16125 [Caldilineaceae bacterium]|nr:hypothetical protein [Caldilineaceae bacterium]
MSAVVRAILVVGFMFTQVSVVAAQDEPIPIDTKPTAIESITTTVETVGAPVSPVLDRQAVAAQYAYHQQTPLPLKGRAMYYNPGIMETVLENRLRFGTVDICGECIGYVAMMRVGDLNRRVWIQLPDDTVHGPFQVIDAADVGHVPMLIEKEWAIDVDYETAHGWGMRSPWRVTVLSEPPANIQPAPLVVENPEFQVDIYRGEKLAYYNQSAEYFGHIDELYIR